MTLFRLVLDSAKKHTLIYTRNELKDINIQGLKITANEVSSFTITSVYA